MAKMENKEALSRKRFPVPIGTITDSRLKRKRGTIESIETETEKEFKSLVQSQLKTNVTLDSVLQNPKSFTSSFNYAPTLVAISGIQTLSEYKAATIEEDNIAELRSCGLTDDEVAIYNSHKNGTSNKLQQDTIKKLEGKIAEHKRTVMKQTQSLSATKYLNRHEMEIEASITKHRPTSKLYGHLVKPLESKSSSSNVEHFWHDVQQRSLQLSSLEPRSNSDATDNLTCDRDAVNNFKCDDANELMYTDKCATDYADSSSVIADSRTNVAACADILSTTPTCAASSDSTCVSTDVSCRCEDSDLPVASRRVVTPSVSTIPEDVIVRFRLSVDDIRKLPKFSNYSPGQPSQVLYLKNLSSGVTEEDLISLFGRYEQVNGDKIVYRLLSGRMHGQAFVTFADANVASQALHLVNGYHFKGKPILIQFGHGKNAQLSTAS